MNIEWKWFSPLAIVVWVLLIAIICLIVFAPPKPEYKVQVIDGCEYIRIHNSMAHKGNCKYCKGEK